MKILQVNKHYAPDYDGAPTSGTLQNIGGVEKVVVSYAEGLVNRGHKVRVLAGQARREGSQRYGLNGVDVTLTHSFGTLSSTPLSPRFFLDWKRACDWADIVHLHEPFPLSTLAAVTMTPKAPIVVSWHADIVRQKVLGRYLVRPLQKQLCQKADLILPTSMRLAQHSDVLSEFLERCRSLPIGIPLDRFEPSTSLNRDAEAVRARFGGRFGLTVGRLVYYKGLTVLLEALAKSPDVTFVIAGEGPQELELRTQVQALGLSDRVHVTGKFIPEAELAAWYNACDFFVMASTHNAEGFGIVQVEAMACGRPVVNTDLPTGVPEVSLDGETGFTAKAGDADSLANAISRLWNDPVQCKALGESAKKRAHSEFTESRMLGRLEEAYSKVLR